MKYSKIIILGIVFLGFAFMGYQCGSTELTSAKLYINQKNYDKALPLLEEEVQKNPKSDEGYYLLGYVYGVQGDYDKMKDAFNKSLEISNNFQENITQLNQAYWVQEFNKAVKSFNQAQGSANKDSAKVFFDKAANSFQNAIAIAPDSTDAYLNLAFVHISEGNYDKAQETLTEFLDRGKSPEAYLYLGRILLDKATNLKQTDSLQASKSYDQAIRTLEEGRKLYPNNAEILGVLQNAYIGANRLEEAEGVFEQAAEVNPDSPQHQYNYGVILLGANQFEQAEQQFKKAVDLKPDYTDALYNLGVTYVEWGNSINKQAEENPEMESSYKEKYQQALPYLEKVVELEPDNVSAWDALYKVYARLNMMKEAEDAYDKVNKLRNQ